MISVSKADAGGHGEEVLAAALVDRACLQGRAHHAVQSRLRGVFGIVHHHLGKRLFDPQLPLHALLIGRGELGHGDEQRTGAVGPGEALQRGGHHGGGTGGV